MQLPLLTPGSPRILLPTLRVQNVTQTPYPPLTFESFFSPTDSELDVRRDIALLSYLLSSTKIEAENKDIAVTGRIDRDTITAALVARSTSPHRLAPDTPPLQIKSLKPGSPEDGAALLREAFLNPKPDSVECHIRDVITTSPILPLRPLLRCINTRGSKSPVSSFSSRNVAASNFTLILPMADACGLRIPPHTRVVRVGSQPIPPSSGPRVARLLGADLEEEVSALASAGPPSVVGVPKSVYRWTGERIAVGRDVGPVSGSHGQVQSSMRSFRMASSRSFSRMVLPGICR
ncbi:hypothetical protein BD310DRAFT_229777 [Dichomitus squalens]|uniref:Uncharacterized protein n=1 Tax=Dichomitus squalens TaxID=114155 RepID=A0A4Q9PGV5_9APHY|nr:hypothetical protein BD310DRAFT_229777 [Dichomitus squalens]